MNRFDDLYLLSRESFEQGLLDKYAERICKKATKKAIEAQLFEDLNSWRDLLARDIKKTYERDYGAEILDEMIQTLLDRFILIRKIEDANLESKKLQEAYNLWSSPKNTKSLWHHIRDVFDYYEIHYDSKIFDKKKNELDRIEISDYPLKIILPQLYTSTDKTIQYNFELIPADILGNIYEKYLGNILKTTDKRTKITNGRATRKEQGIYYTPRNIVDYIVSNTLGQVLEKCRDVQCVEKIKVLDPACGSGSFLIRAFDEICSWYEKNGLLVERYLSTESYRMLETVKDRIIRNNLFGVDLDSKAVEIAQLNLLLKTADKRHQLPQLKENIKQGNSLIDDKIVDSRAFKWEAEFKEIISNGGFDVAIGNPPYVNMQTLPELQKWCETRYPEIYTGQNDILYYFVFRGLDVLKNGGKLGFITSRYFLESSYARKFRKFILENSTINRIIDFNNFQVFGREVNVLTSIIILTKGEHKPQVVKVVKIKNWNRSGSELMAHILKNEEKSVYSDEYIDIFGIDQKELSDEPWALSNPRINAIKEKIEENSQPLSEICNIGQGMTTGLNEAFVIDAETAINEEIEQEVLRNYVKTRDLKRYTPLNRDLKIIYIPDKINENKIRHTLNHLKKWENELKQRYDYIKGHCEWYSWGNLRNREFFESGGEKIITPLYSTSNKFVYDSGKTDQDYCTLTDTYLFVPKKPKTVRLKLILAILNSTLMEFYFKNTAKLKREGYYEYAGSALSNLPIRSDQDSADKVENMVKEIIALKKRLNKIGDKMTNERQRIEDEIERTEREIDELVYKTYGITEDEKRIIEESLK